VSRRHPVRPLLSVALLGAWVGAALLTAAVVAPAAFAVLPTRALAGALVGRILPVVFLAGLVVGAVAAALGDRALPHGRVRIGAGVVLALSCAVAQFLVAPRIQRLREQIGPVLEAIAPEDPRRMAFGRLHGVSVLLLGVGLVAAAVALTSLLLALRQRS
jgi:hypothetical protein